jgi:alkylation response protein AidB-like acyl-CoA dehydrogenase
MDTRSTLADEVRAEARDWFERQWDPARPLGEWWEMLARSGWGFPSWPQAWFGRGLPPDLAVVVNEERARAGATGLPETLGTKAIAPLLVSRGDDLQRQRYLLPTISGQAIWCELFSEPGAGSDLASLATRAGRDGDEWVINGQKVWSSGAPVSRWGLLVARTDPDVPKQRGLSCFVVDMHSAGVETRPLRTMTGEYKFSEVFLDDVRVPATDVVGEIGRGWDVVKDTLALERKVIGPASGTGGMVDNNRIPALDRPAGDVAAEERAGRQRGAMVTGAGGMALVRTLLECFGGADDPVTRQQVAGLYCLQEVVRYTALRTRASQRRREQPGFGPGPAASIMKLLTGRSAIALRQVALRIEGPRGMLFAADAPLGGVVQKLTLASPSMAIMAGTDEIQKNIIAERVLGLPPEPSSGRDVPWRQLHAGRPTGGPR